MDGDKILQDLSFQGIRYFHLTWVDNVNCVRYRVIPFQRFKKLIASPSSSSTDQARSKVNRHGGITITKATLGLVVLNLAEGFGPAGMYVYVPDLSTIRPLAYAPGHAFVMGWLEEQVGTVSPNGVFSFSSKLCARSKVRDIVDDAFSEHGISFMMGFETEVIFLSSASSVTPVHDYSWSETSAMLAGRPETLAVQEIADALETAGIVLDMYHAEGAPGQYEFVTGPLSPLEACDALVCTREIILNVCSKHGIKATMTPRLFKKTVGSAAHTHISLKSNKLPSNPMILPGDSDPSLTNHETSFLAGLLEHLPGATIFTLPTPASYDRMVDGVWSGGTYVSWGWENKEVPVRICGVPGSGLANYHFEVKTVDGTASPYLVAAALLAAGMDGVKHQKKLLIEGVGNATAAQLSPSERDKLGIRTRLPLDVAAAREALKSDKLFTEVLGEEFITKYLAVNKTLGEYLDQGNDDEKTQRMIKTY
ncbi:glutamine synthetase/guanido kinase [Schizopora paradoxa]|uniref:Glutamine synthetase n=1 Tax=Schizopora paradoxa TaxID=27342 RepID=A0A0H2R7Q4_9AGAM|nr:glutamine synthetase/guanido kinase [Schizopora paradoxa]